MDINKRAVQQAKKELDKEKVQIIKDLILKNLRKIEETKIEMAKLQKKLKLLKQDQEDIEQGKIDAIIERQEKSKIAKDESVFKPKDMEIYYPEITNITKNVSDGSFYSSNSNYHILSNSISSASKGTYAFDNKEYYIS
jgi:hypothetical protein